MRPVISIITVTKNDAPGLLATLESIAKQTYRNIEYIVIDGGNDKRSASAVSKYRPIVSYYTRAPDNGIYDAMNRGLNRASGEFVCFINAGDCLYSRDTLQLVADSIDQEVDVVFGEVMFVDKNHRDLGLRSQVTTQQLPQKLTWRSMEFGMVVSHQGFYARKALAPAYIKDNLCADIDWVIRILKSSRRNVRVNEPLAKFAVGGTSTRRFRRAMWDRFKVLSKHFGMVRTIFNHVSIIARRALFRVRARFGNLA